MHPREGERQPVDDQEPALWRRVPVPRRDLVAIRAHVVPFEILGCLAAAADARGVAGVDRERTQVGRQPVADAGETVRRAVGEVSR